jgi:hypothetical protein
MLIGCQLKIDAKDVGNSISVRKQRRSEVMSLVLLHSPWIDGRERTEFRRASSSLQDASS